MIDNCVSTKKQDIIDIINFRYGTRYSQRDIHPLLNAYKIMLVELYELASPVQIVQAFLYESKFLTSFLNLKIEFKEYVDLYTSDSIQQASVYQSKCQCGTMYDPNTYTYGSSRYVTSISILNQSSIYLGGKSAYKMEVLYDFADALKSMYTGFENFCNSYYDRIMNSVLNKQLPNEQEIINNLRLLERRSFQNTWLVYRTVLFHFFMTNSSSIEIPLLVSDTQQRNNYFLSNIDRWNVLFTSLWSSHKDIKPCKENCSVALITDGCQKPDRPICGFREVYIKSEELGNIQWGCGAHPLNDKQQQSKSKYCGKHQHHESKFNTDKFQQQQIVDENQDTKYYTDADCNVSRDDRFMSRSTLYGILITLLNCGVIVSFEELYLCESTTRTLYHWIKTINNYSRSTTIIMPRYWIYDNACGILLTFNARLRNQRIIITPAVKQLQNMRFVIDRFHMENHKRPIYKIKTNPNKYHDLNDVNTQACEQLNAKLKRYQNAFSSYTDPKSRIFYLILFHEFNCKLTKISPYKNHSNYVKM
ncbi:unnamed protein product [Didymodactylos carnosus]|uniref:Uncharacterized protein n=1 Tax=Didymodactylos carnosus TaxID=1234261 RepID=A0A8S2Q0N8_9BILA|nr:unnamed protein product [Didymodactylos carnosus]CAF4081390.1 unnamed protein product [Didymodactylos carnosus]